MAFFSGEWDMNPYAKRLWSELFPMLQSGATPEGILSPIRQMGEKREANIRKRHSRIPFGNLSGLEGAEIMRSQAGTQRAFGEAGSKWKAQLMQMLMGLSGQQQYEPAQLGVKDIMQFLI